MMERPVATETGMPFEELVRSMIDEVRRHRGPSHSMLLYSRSISNGRVNQRRRLYSVRMHYRIRAAAGPWYSEPQPPHRDKS